MIEVLKQALEALETTWYHVGTFAPTDDAIELYDQARTSLRKAIAELESQEPVACGTYQEVTDTMNALWAGTLEQVQIAEEMKNKKLYTAPPQRTEQEPVAWADHGVVNWIADKQFKHASLLYTHPPQRKPLTDGDFLDWYDSAIWGNEDFKQCCQIAFEAGWQFAHGIKE